jgi:hypothetical protein
MTSSTDSTDGTNFADFGMYSTSAMRDSTELVWIATEEDYWWSSYISGIKFDTGTGLDDAYTIDADYGRAYIDTSSSCTYIPSEYWRWTVKQILADIDSEDYEKSDLWGYVLPCSKASELKSV